MPGAFELRPARHTDADEVAAIETLAFSDPWSRNAFAALIGNPAVLFLVAAALPAEPAALRPRIVGYVVAWFAADESEIANIAVAPSARGRGIGAALLDAALTEAVRRSAATTYLEVRESNLVARNLYAARGFTELGRRRNYYRHPREDALVLGRPTDAGRTSTGGVESAHRA
ncbi:MAG TPA: ribosomal protein S18-alanine N-acetyltransferase [Gemmatirosa sp.]